MLDGQSQAVDGIAQLAAGRTSGQVPAVVSASFLGWPGRDRSGGNVRDERQDGGHLIEGACLGTGKETRSERANAIDELARTDLAALHRRAFRLTRDHHAAQDLVQDTLERAYRKISYYQPGTSMPAWLACIMRNVWISNHRRRAGAPPTVSLEAMDAAAPDQYRRHPAASSDVEMSVVDALSAASIHLAIDGLPSHLRQVIVMADVEERRYGTIAETLAIPPGTVASRLSRGRRRLKQLLLDQARGGDRLPRAS